MQVYVDYFLSQKGRMEARKKSLPSEHQQHFVFEDPKKETITLRGFGVDEKGFARIDLDKWALKDEDGYPRTCKVLDKPLQTLKDVLKLCGKLDEEYHQAGGGDEESSPGVFFAG